MQTSLLTEVFDQCSLASLLYLKRNGFTAIKQHSRQLLSAKDGTRSVHIWLALEESEGLAVPLSVFEQAARARARVDVIGLRSEGGQVSIRHMMNV